MKFLIKIEEAMDKFILAMIAHLKELTPEFVFGAFFVIVGLPALIKKKVKATQPKIRIFFLKLVGYTDHYTTMIRGHLVGFLIYLRSEEFKKKNKVEMVVAPLKKFKTDPVKAFSVSLVLAFFSVSSFFIYKNAAKILIGTKALRTPASSRYDQDPILEFRKLKYKTILPAGAEVEVGLDVTILAASHEELDKMMTSEDKILEHLQAYSPKVMELPLTKENKHEIELDMQNSLLQKFHNAGIKKVEVKQVLNGRPKYFMQTERLLSFTDTNLQLFLEDTRRNRQVWVDFTALSSNRFVILYLKEHLVEIKDHLNVNVEPVIPRLPLEEEGRQIIKDKLRDEINAFLKKEKVEGKILEIYIDYLIVS